MGYVIIVFIYILAYHFYNQKNRGLEKNEERELNGHKLIYKEMERKISIKYFLPQPANYECIVTLCSPVSKPDLVAV